MIGELSGLLGILTLGLLSPGPDFLLVLRSSLSGTRRALGTISGIAAGLAIQTSLIAMGFAFLAAKHPAFLQWIRWAGAIFLAYLGVRSWLSASRSETKSEAEILPVVLFRAGFLEGFLCNLSNAKAFIFFISLYSQFVGNERNENWQFAFPIIIVLHALICWTALSRVFRLAPIRKRLEARALLIQRLFGVGLVILACLTAFSP